MDAEFRDYAALGVDWVRTNFWWDLAQRTPDGSYNWSKMDLVVDTAAQHGIKVIGEFNGAPSWIDPKLDSGYDRAEFRDYAVEAVRHFKDRVDHWEVWNEQNMHNIKPADYASLLKTIYPAIKAVDADATVITGGLAATPQTGNGLIGAVDYLEGIYENGAAGYFDAVGFHPYTYPLLPSSDKPWNGWQIMEDGIYPTMIANGDGDLKVWMTELGAPTSGGGHEVSQAFQAKIISEAADLASNTDWAGPIMWYSYKDRGGSHSDKENWFGIVGPGGQRKDAYYTYKSIATTQERDHAEKVENTAAPETTEPVDLTVYGSNGGETLRGGAGDDTLLGRAGNDTLWGGAGADRFVFEEGMGWDTIRDFGEGDVIDLSRIDANKRIPGNQAFDFIESNWIRGVEDLGFYKDARGWTSVQGDITGDGRFDFSIRLIGQHDLTAEDFVF